MCCCHSALGLLVAVLCCVLLSFGFRVGSVLGNGYGMEFEAEELGLGIESQGVEYRLGSKISPVYTH